MQREILISVDPRETRLAVLEDGQVAEVKIEREANTVGNIYKGVVESVLPGMDSAFVDIGLERNAFLHASDASTEVREMNGGGRRRRRHVPIRELVQPKDELMLQLTKEPIGDKGARVTARISLPGRWVVLLPVGANYVGVSKKIVDDDERRRLKEIGKKVRPRSQGLIIRTEAQGCEESEIEEDVAMLKELWGKMRTRYRSKKGPNLIHEDLGLTERMVRDFYSDDVSRIQVDTQSECDRVRQAVRNIRQGAGKKVKLYSGRAPLFEARGVDQALEEALERKVRLPSGGNITVDETEAVVAIDVNTGHYTGSRRGRGGLKDTVLKTNLEAAKEIPRQLRLRDLGGIIILDFIDMYNASHKRQVMDALEEGLALDRARTRVVHLSPLGLVEMTRKRTGQSLFHSMCDVCPHCRGRGRALSPEALVARLERELKRESRKRTAKACQITVPPEVAFELIGPGGHGADELEAELKMPLYIRARGELPADGYEIETGSKEDIARGMREFRYGQMFHVRPERYGENGDGRYFALVDGYVIEIDHDDHVELGNGLVTVSLTDVSRSWAQGTVIE